MKIAWNIVASCLRLAVAAKVSALLSFRMEDARHEGWKFPLKIKLSLIQSTRRVYASSETLWRHFFAQKNYAKKSCCKDAAENVHVWAGLKNYWFFQRNRFIYKERSMPPQQRVAVSTFERNSPDSSWESHCFLKFHNRRNKVIFSIKFQSVFSHFAAFTQLYHIYFQTQLWQAIKCLTP